MTYSLRFQIRSYRAKYPVYLYQDFDADSPEVAIVLGWEWARKLKGVKGPHTVLNVALQS